MKVLLTGASGFVGSHILDHLRALNISTSVLLRASSNRCFVEPHQQWIEVRPGAIDDPESLEAALEGISHVIHCAGRTKAVRISEFYDTNQVGTRNVVRAVNSHQGEIKRLVHISSLAAAGPATPSAPARETDPPHPVSEYGKSKLAGELEVRDKSQIGYVILRPPAVYGPRDTGFLSLFQAVRNHLLPRPSRRQALSLVFVRDLAAAVVACLDHPKAAGKTWFVANREIVTGRQMAEQIAHEWHRWTLPCPLPAGLLWMACFGQELVSRVTRKPSLLNLQKFAELRAPGWVCDPSALERETGFTCQTNLREGIAQTLKWYRDKEWL